MEKAAIITGGTRGIGLGIVHRLAERGWNLVVLANTPSKDEEFTHLQNEGRLHFIGGDVADPAARSATVDRAVKSWGRIDLLVNNAGMAPLVRTDLLEMSVESYDRVMDVNLRGPLLLTQTVSKAMIELRGDIEGVPQRPIGTIINTGSASATMVSTNRGEYCISKVGVTMMTKLFAVRLAPESIAVYEVRPGIIETDMTAVVKDKYDRLILEQGGVPIARWGQPADVAAAVDLLASGELPYSTGDTIFVDGGMHIPVL